MKSNHPSIYFFIMSFSMMMFSSCTLFIDDDLVGVDNLPKYEGNGYDAPVHETGEYYDVTYQYQPSTKTLHTDEEAKYVLKMNRDSADYFHYLVYDINTPHEELPIPGQCLVSSNLDKFPNGLGDKVISEKKSNKGYLVITRHASLEEIFKDLKLEANIPVSENISDYDYYDADSVLHHAKIEKNNQNHYNPNGPLKVAKWDTEFGLPPFKFSLGGKPINKKAFKLLINGEVSWKSFVYVKLELWELPVVRLRNDIDLNANARISLGIKGEGKKKKPKRIEQFLIGNSDFLKGRLKWPIGPVVLVPKFGITVNFQAEANAFTTIKGGWSYHGTFGAADDPDVPQDKPSSGPDWKIEGGVMGEIDFPVIKVKFGLGCYTNIVSVNLELIGTAYAKGGLSISTDDFSTEEEEEGGEEFEDPSDVYKWALSNDIVHIDNNPEVSINWKTELGISAGVDSEQLKEVKEAVDKAAKELSDEILTDEIILAVIEDTKEVEDWFNNLPESELLEELSQDVSSPFLYDQEYYDMLKGQKEDKEKELENNKEQVETGEKINRYDLQASAVWTLNFLTWEPIWQTYFFPKMNDKSFRVGRKWNDDKSKLIFTAEYILDDPGYMSKFIDYYPGFLVKLGNEAIMYYPCDIDKPINWDTPKGTRIKAELTGLSENHSYSCIPCYASSRDGKYTVFNKGISFSSTTPSISLIGLQENGATASQGENSYVYTCHFTTTTHVVGSRNIREWGLIDNNDKNDKTKYHKSKDAGELNPGFYTHNWRVKSSKPKIKISLTPYLIAKDETLTDAKYYSTWEETLDFTNLVVGESLANTYSGDFATDDFVLELESVTFTPDEVDRSY